MFLVLQFLHFCKFSWTNFQNLNVIKTSEKKNCTASNLFQLLSVLCVCHNMFDWHFRNTVPLLTTLANAPTVDCHRPTVQLLVFNCWFQDTVDFIEFTLILIVARLLMCTFSGMHCCSGLLGWNLHVNYGHTKHPSLPSLNLWTFLFDL